MNWNLIKDGRRSGAYNMALDVYLIEHPPLYPLLRLYSWLPPAVSIGYNQNIHIINKDLLETYGVDIVRRPTGGRAVLHCCELTYSVIIPKNIPLFNAGIHELYYIVSKALVNGLQRYGISAAIERNKPNTTSKENNVLTCFESTARFEIKSNGKKIVGSAQRRTAHAILQHGSIVLKNEQDIIPYVLEDSSEIPSTLIPECFVNKKIKTSNAKKLNSLENNIINGFEDEFHCEWKKELHTNNFKKRQADFERNHIIYTTQKR